MKSPLSCYKDREKGLHMWFKKSVAVRVMVIGVSFESRADGQAILAQPMFSSSKQSITAVRFVNGYLKIGGKP
jgi:hypothetical protein